MSDHDAALRQLVDRDSIKTVIADYGLYYDSGDFESFTSLFTADATYDITPDPGLFPVPVTGRDAIVGAMAERWNITADTSGSSPRHMSTNISIRELTHSAAHVFSFLLVCFVHPDGNCEIRRSGTYVDRFRKEEAGWLFTSRHLHLFNVPDRGVITGSPPACSRPSGAD
ncbi:nuclear transport factor 2 family protein [Frankia sp. Cr2]|uniref:nuclear transport factor 2 family protein n=1 Tax=Frankia sp. Cr2 TaxID=3073932 RepID=UPI002AD4BBE5|nr:nuclear transport factor 2 family protein [Frankia sp. Cr2]